MHNDQMGIAGIMQWFRDKLSETSNDFNWFWYHKYSVYLEDKMSKLYIRYIPKVEGEYRDFKIVESLKKYMQSNLGKNNIIAAPGYMSSYKKVKDFAQEFKDIVPNEEEFIFIGYFKCLNWEKLFGRTTSDIIISKHYNELQKTGKFKKIKIKISNKRDHRKMMFLFKIVADSSFDFESDILDKTNKDKFLSSIIVNAILIGSSNQSYNTYYGGGKGQADKGEADVLMFVSDESASFISETMDIEGTIVFEEICGIGSKSPHEYLKEILNDFLSKSLL